MEKTSYDHGVPSWVDIGTDIEKAAAFYSGLFGWLCPPGPEEAGGYINAQYKGKAVAGIGPQQNPGPPYWSTYINVDGADDAADKVAAAGGQVVMAPFDVMEVGRMAIFTDPQGAFFGVWQPGTHKGAGLVNEPNTLCWNELVTTDVEAAKPFYHAVFGWDAETTTEGPMPYTEWKLAGASIGGAMGRPEGLPAEVPNHWAVYFAVEDLDKSLAMVGKLGGVQLMDPIDTPAGRFAPVLDDCGASFNLIQLSGEM